MVWLFVALAAFSLFAATALIDKFLLAGKLDDPGIYAFYVGILSATALLLLPFGFWANPAPPLFLLASFAGAAQIYGDYFYFSALKRMEASRAVPAVGSLTPICVFFFTAAVSGGAAVLGAKELVGLSLLIAGGWLVMARGVSIKKEGLFFVLTAPLFFAANVVLAKLVYLQLPFLNGFLLMAFGSAAAAITFLLSKSVRQAVFHSRRNKRHQPNFLFFLGQGLGGAAFLTQSFAVFLAPQASVPAINAMAGVQYVLIFIFSLVLARRWPGVFAVKITPADLAQKIIAILLIAAGLAVFILG
jgi:hypothetical protein